MLILIRGLFVLFLLLYSFTSFASNGRLEDVTAEPIVVKLPVLDAPSGNVIGSLLPETKLYVYDAEDGFAYVGFDIASYSPALKTDKNDRGWVDIDKIDFSVGRDNEGSYSLYKKTGEHCYYNGQLSGAVCINADRFDMRCDKADDGISFTSCQLDLEYTLSADYKGAGAPSDLLVNAKCAAELIYESKEGGERLSFQSNDRVHKFYPLGVLNSKLSIVFNFKVDEFIAEDSPTALKGSLSSIMCRLANVSLY